MTDTEKTTAQRYRETGMRPPSVASEPPPADATIAHLREYAQDHDIDLAGTSRKAEIVEAITGPDADLSDSAAAHSTPEASA